MAQNTSQNMEATAKTEELKYIEPISSTQDEVLNYISNVSSGITFIHGKAGSGKTYIIRKIEKQIAGCKVLTPTNLASSLYYNGADDLLSFLDTEKRHRVTIHVVPSEEPLTVEDHTELRQIDKSTFGGSHYDSTDFVGFRMKKIWICPVTLCVLGCYPKYLYIQKIA